MKWKTLSLSPGANVFRPRLGQTLYNRLMYLKGDITSLLDIPEWSEILDEPAWNC